MKCIRKSGRARLTLVIVAAAGALLAAGPAASRTDEQTAQPKPCSGSTVGGVAVLDWCGPAKATVKLAGRTLTFKGGVCGISKASGITAWTLNIGRFTNVGAKPKFMYFGGIGPAKLKAGTYTGAAAIEFGLSFQTPGKAYTIGQKKVTITAGGKKGTFSGRALLVGPDNEGTPVSGSWTC